VAVLPSANSNGIDMGSILDEFEGTKIGIIVLHLL